jgi:acyl-CoA reductase-like NAD-dependent aldehyde dehydrogenase
MSFPETDLASWVGASWRRGPSIVPDINPAHPGEPVAVVHEADTALAEEAVAAAHGAFGTWRLLPAPARGDILHGMGRMLEERAEAIGRDLSREEGKTIGEAIGEVRLAAKIFRYFGAQTLDADGETYPSHTPDTLLFARREPLGVVSVLTPWNFPIAIAAWKIAPALAFGNTVVWKPAGLVPLTAVHLTHVAIDSGLPAGVLNLILGSGSVVGDVLVTHRDVAAISFTGSNSVGHALHVRAISAGKKAQLEMGGKNAAVVLADADLDLAAQKVAQGAFLGTGQKCTSTSRVAVEEAVFDDFLQRLVSNAGELRLGDPLDPSTNIGPLASAGQLESVLAHLDTARRDGATTVAGGGRPSDDLDEGYYIEPTVLVGLDPSSSVATEEIFGPVVMLQSVASFEDSMGAANNSRFGLSASIFTNDLTKAMRFKDQIRCGMVRINGSTTATEFHVPFGGMKESGTGGREQGKAAREFFTEWKTVYMGLPG